MINLLKLFGLFLIFHIVNATIVVIEQSKPFNPPEQKFNSTSNGTIFPLDVTTVAHESQSLIEISNASSKNAKDANILHVTEKPPSLNQSSKGDDLERAKNVSKILRYDVHDNKNEEDSEDYLDKNSLIPKATINASIALIEAPSYPKGAIVIR